ncbi:hypothetical protein HWV62_22317 [Athelia sp. TMB]|nr:hypothetical protein HWV62_22317 [Athelia sp. TMB]
MAKRKDPPAQATTLFNFFSSDAPAVKKGKTRPTTPKHKSNLQTSSASTNSEVIIIDSDSDTDTIVSKGKGKEREVSSEVEIVDGPVFSGSTRKPKATGSHSGLSTKRQEASISFGEPILLRSSNEVKGELSTRALTRASSPVSLESDGPARPSIYPIQGASYSTSKLKDSSVIDLSDDEWAMGDDEMALVDPDDFPDEDMEEVDTEAPQVAQAARGANTCPVCNKSFNALLPRDAQEHVGRCIDTISSSSSLSSQINDRSALASPAKTLLPLSSIQALHRPTASTFSPATSSNAFSVLMTSHKENEAWKEASIAEDRTFRPTKNNRRKAPFYKVLQGMPIAVDAFRYGSIPEVTAYFLTHAHSDHYTNLAANWKSGPIYCSEGTANLIIHMLSVDPKWVHPLPMDVPTVIPNTGGVKVTLIEANHCPGSCLFFYEGPQTIDAGDSTFKSPFVGSSRTFRYLHCGDFRASPRHVLHPAVKGKRIDHIYLDTTYLDPKYTFPPQPLVISACAELARRIVAGQSTSDGAGERKLTMDSFVAVDKSPEKKKEGRTLVVVGTYSIGKERIVKAIAKALNSKVYCDARKAAILRCQSDPELHALLTTDPLAAIVHVVPLGLIAADKLATYIERFKGKFTRVVGFRPTGWTYTAPAGAEQSPSVPSIISRAAARPPFTYSSLKPMRNSTAALTLYGVPYSEHSSFFELTCFAMSLEWTKMIATVNVGSAVSRGKMSKWVERWEAERKKRGKMEIVKYRELDYW